MDDGDVHHAEAALHLALLALQLDVSSLGGRSCGEEEEDDDGCPRSCRRRPGGPMPPPREEDGGGDDGDGASAALGEEEDGGEVVATGEGDVAAPDEPAEPPSRGGPLRGRCIRLR